MSSRTNTFWYIQFRDLMNKIYRFYYLLKLEIIWQFELSYILLILVSEQRFSIIIIKYRKNGGTAIQIIIFSKT